MTAFYQLKPTAEELARLKKQQEAKKVLRDSNKVFTQHSASDWAESRIKHSI